jgi:polyisoprenoid-binding protein YceI
MGRNSPLSTWKIDPAHTDVSFSAKHMMITTVRGKFAQVEGELELDENEPGRSRGQIRVAAASLSTGFDARDQHLRSADFFDVESHPWIAVSTTSVKPKDDGTYAVAADVTIRGVTRPVTFDVEYLGTTPGMRGGRHAGFTAKAKVNRKDWGLNWNMALEAGGWLVGDDIKLEIDVAGDEVAVATAGSADIDAQRARAGAAA